MKRRIAKHGTSTRYYTLKCRCDRCKKFARDYMRELRAKLKDSKIPHGTVNGYQNYKCRCRRCSKAQAEYRRREKAAAVA